MSSALRIRGLTGSPFTRAWRFALGSFVAVTMLSILILANGGQALMQLLRPFSRPLARRATEQWARCYWALCAWLSRRVFRTKIVITGDAIAPRENAVVFSNHQTMTDQVVLFELGIQGKMLGQQRTIAKDSIKWLPGIGWGAWLHGSILVKRDWLRDERTVRAAFQRFSDEQIPVWLTLYPEGTRVTPSKLKQSQDFAAQKGLYVPQRGLSPRTKGFAAAVNGLRGHIRRIYDVSIYYPGGVPPLFIWACGAVKEIYVDVKAFPIEDLPRDEEGLGMWLSQRFAEKDRWLLEQERLHP